MKVLITGGAGYIGSTIASALLDQGLTPVILDNLVTGRSDYVADRIFYLGDIADGQLVDRIFLDHPGITAVVHCAGLIVVPESVSQPLRYYLENVSKTIDLLGHVVRNNCRRIVFSSTAALYAELDGAADETSAVTPISPYGRTKAFVESILDDCAQSGELRAIALRYFNPIGADPQMRTGPQFRRPSNALGKLLEAWENGDSFAINGTDWPTRDGTTLRDYIHVWDLAMAHVAALTRFDQVMADSSTGYEVFNLGTGQGTTVRELIAAFSAATGTQLPSHEMPRRNGDIAGSIATKERAATVLGWTPRHTLEEAIRHAVQWREYDQIGQTAPAPYVPRQLLSHPRAMLAATTAVGADLT